MFGKILLVLYHLILLAAIGLLFVKVSGLEQKPEVSKSEILKTEVTCGLECEERIKNEVAEAIKELDLTSPQPSAISQPQVSTHKKEKQTTYIPLSASQSTTSTEWVDVNSAETWVDLKKDYSASALVSWDVSLRTESGSGEAQARLFDVTHGIVVLGSEVSTSNKTTELLASGSLNLWSGKNLYRVQIKSLNSSNVFIGSARIKISY